MVKIGKKLMIKASENRRPWSSRIQALGRGGEGGKKRDPENEVDPNNQVIAKYRHIRMYQGQFLRMLPIIDALGRRSHFSTVMQERRTLGDRLGWWTIVTPEPFSFAHASGHVLAYGSEAWVNNQPVHNEKSPWMTFLQIGELCKLALWTEKHKKAENRIDQENQVSIKKLKKKLKAKKRLHKNKETFWKNSKEKECSKAYLWVRE